MRMKKLQRKMCIMLSSLYDSTIYSYPQINKWQKMVGNLKIENIYITIKFLKILLKWRGRINEKINKLK